MAITSMVAVLFLAVASVGAILAAEDISTTSVIEVVYHVDKVAGSAKAEYKVGSATEWTSMEDGAGNATLTYNNTKNFEGSLSPEEEIELTEVETFVLFKYSFNNKAESEYYVSASYADTNSATDPDKNVTVTYSTDGTNWASSPSVMTIVGIGAQEEVTAWQTLWVKVEITDEFRSSEFSGTFTFNLTGDQPQPE